MITTSARRERRCLHGVEYHGARIRAGLLLDDVGARAIGPYAQLLDGRGAKRVAGGEHHVFARIGETAREFADGGGFAGAIHAHHQQHEGFRGELERLLRRQQDGRDCIRQRRDQRVDVVEFSARHFSAQLFEDVLRGVDADVGGQQARFEFVEYFGVDLAAGHEVGKVIGEPRTRTVELRAHARDETLLGGWFSAIGV